MNTKKILTKDVIVLKEKDRLDDNMLSDIIGGNSLAMDCTCKCDSGNCYEDSPSEPSLPILNA
jgi:hypothetical protein